MYQNEIMQLELAMTYEDSELFEESGNLYGIIEKLTGSIKKIIINMKTFAAKITTHIDETITTMKLRMKLNQLKKAAKTEVIRLPDMPYLVKTYKKSIAKLQKEVTNISKELNGLHLKRETKKINDYLKEREELEQRIVEISVEIETACTKTIQLNPDGAELMIKKTISDMKLWVSEYTKLIADVERLAIDFQKNTEIAEIDYGIKVAMRENISMLNKIQIGATKLLRKGVFLACSVIG